MVAHGAPLTDAQFKVLQWINDGRPEGVVTGWAHRTSARALASRGLARVQGHGANWTAAIEPAGTYYLEHGAFPDQPSVRRRARSAPKRRHQPRPEPAPRPITNDDAAGPGARSAPKVPKVGVAEQLIETLREAGKSGLTVAPDDLLTIRRRLARAERDDRIPAEHRVACQPARINEQHGAILRLQPIPRWHVATLRPSSSRCRLKNPTSCGASEDEGSTRSLLRLKSSSHHGALTVGMSPGRSATRPQVPGFRLWAVVRSLSRRHRIGATPRAAVRFGLVANLSDYWRTLCGLITKRTSTF